MEGGASLFGDGLFLALASLLLLANSFACNLFDTADTSLCAPPDVDAAATAGLVVDDRSLIVAEGVFVLLRHKDWISWEFFCACPFVLFASVVMVGPRSTVFW